MKRVAMLLVLSMMLQLISPAIVTEAAPQNAQENGIVLQESAEENLRNVSDGNFNDENVTDGDSNGGNVSDGNSIGGDVSDGNSIGGDVSDNDPGMDDSSSGDVTDGDPDAGAVSDGDTSSGNVSGGDASDGNASGGDASGADLSTGDIMSVVEEAEYTEVDGFFQKQYFAGAKGYSLVVGAVLEKKPEVVDSVRFQLDAEAVVTIGKLDKSAFSSNGYDNSYALTLSLAKKPVKISEGQHDLTVWFQADGAFYKVSGTAEFVDRYTAKDISKGSYYNEGLNPPTNYVNNKKGTIIENKELSFLSYHKGEAIKGLQLVQSETGTAVKIKQECLKFKTESKVSYDYSYQTFFEKNGRYYYLNSELFPKEVYSMYACGTKESTNFVLTLQEDIPEGLYDVVAITNQGRTYRIEKMYQAFAQPVVYGAYVEDGTEFVPVNSLSDESERRTNGNLFYADNTGNYLTLFVYGSGVNQSLLPAFYSEAGEVLATYDPLDSGCGYLYGSQWGSYFRLKKTEQGIQLAQQAQGQQPAYVSCYTQIESEAVSAYATDGKIKSSYLYQDVFFYEKIAANALKKGSAERSRLYFGTLTGLKEGEEVTLKLKKYGQADYQQNYVVGKNETGSYIDLTGDAITRYLSCDSAELDRDGTRIADAMFYGINYGPKSLTVQKELKVPAGAEWAVYSMADAVHPILSGVNNEKSVCNVLDGEKLAFLGDYGSVRACIYKDGTILSRNLFFVPEAEVYTITYHMAGGVNPAENPATYRTGDSFELQNPQTTLSGMQFEGFFLDPGYKTRIQTITGTMKGNLDLYAKWVSSTYDIVFDTNAPEGATVTGTMPVMKAAFYADIPLKKNTFKTKEYLFAGWSLEPQAVNGTVQYQDQSEVYNLIDPDGSEGNTVTLYAVWRSEFNITYRANVKRWIYVDQSGFPETYTYGSQFQLPTPKYGGYTFHGWYQDAKYTKKISSITQKTSGDLILYSKWTANTYTIQYDGNGSTSGRMSAQKAVYDLNTVLAENKYQKNGYVFVGWGLVPEADSKDIYPELEKIPQQVEPKENKAVLKLYAQWEPVDYLIVYHTDGGTIQGIDMPDRYSYGQSVILPDQNQIIREGFTFGGWYLDSSYKKKITQITEKTAGNLDLYAKWTADVEVIFEANLPEGAYTGSMKNQTVKYGTVKAIPGNTFKIKDKSKAFAGWAVDPDTDAIYQNKEKINYTEGLIRNNGKWEIHLYAIWKDTFTITYYVDGQTYKTDNYSYGKGIPAGEMAVPVEKSGYQFAGWYSDSKWKKKVTSISAKQTGDIELFAKYTAKSYTIIFEPNHEAIRAKAKTQKFACGTAKALTKNSYKLKGYTFKGWSRTPHGTVDYTDKELFTGENLIIINDRLYLYAVWEKDVYNITYQNISADQAEGMLTQYSVDSATVQLKEPERIGYTFMGWYTDPKMKKSIRQIKTGSTGNLTLYAKWKLNCELK